MALTRLTSEGTITAATTVNGADVVYYSASISTDGKFNFSVTGQVADAMFGTDKKLASEIMSDITAFTDEVYRQANANRAGYLATTVEGE
ncbi:hypothetical protein [Pseudolactococcus raffinolactis]|uniref:hypothetical protein n=1 Tax=Pseudolactococcus raffinolactis TaxID=1366 RepID=UPI0014367FEC|nr:hypothetical protein [Lactococcus raffinolactis]QIW51232.1 hypothetical protein GU337_04750 [Lactococcus raffinolactis]